MVFYRTILCPVFCYRGRFCGGGGPDRPSSQTPGPSPEQPNQEQFWPRLEPCLARSAFNRSSGFNCSSPLAPPPAALLWLLPMQLSSGPSPCSSPLAPPPASLLWLLPLHLSSGSSLCSSPLAPPPAVLLWLLPLQLWSAGLLWV